MRFADGEIETVHRARIGKTRRQAQDGQRFRVIPSAEHGIHGAGEEAHGGCSSSLESK